jgi:hypothetical protein
LASRVEYLAWIFSYGLFSGIIDEKKPNFGLRVLKTDLKVTVERDCWEVVKETRGSLRLLRRRPVTPMSRVDSNEGLVLSDDIVLMSVDSYSCNSN